MPTRPTAIVNGARLTASARLTNGRGSRPSAKRPPRRSAQRWMPWKAAAIATRRQPLGALLALTGLMLEKESELSGAVVGGAAGQQDQGEQSTMPAAEMERRIGLMGRLHDAAARRRQQPAPEVEVVDNDAELWYAACFACTTSLQVVRLFRSKRAELPQRDLMVRSLPGGAGPAGDGGRGKPGPS